MSQEFLAGLENAPQRALLKALGLTDDELERPLIAIVTAGSELSPEFINLSAIADAVKTGVYAGGCTPVVVPSLGMSGSGRYALPARELIADGVETVLSSGMFDGAVFVSGGDEVVAGMLMGAARVNIPSIFVTGGPMASGILGGKKVGLGAVLEGVGKVKSGGMNIDELAALELGACPGYGTPQGDFGCILEALGMALCGNGTKRAQSSARIRLAKSTGLAACELVRNADAPKKIMTKRAFLNALTLGIAIGASPDTVLHLTAVAAECNVTLDIDTVQSISDAVPTLCKLLPSGENDLHDLDSAGGVTAVLHTLAGSKLIDGSLRTVAGESLASFYDEAQVKDTSVIHSGAPLAPVGGITFLKGNLAESGAIALRHADDKTLMSFTGKAKCFDREEDAVEAIYSGKIKKGDVVVIRYEGPVGGPGMREMLNAASALAGKELDKDVALITDGRIGAYGGIAVGYVCPEAADGGKLAIVKDGDAIKIDIGGGRITLDVPAKELQARQKKLRPKDSNATGWLLRYQNLVTPAIGGAVLKKKF